MTYRLILGSSSPRRQQIVAAMGLDYTLIKPHIDETQHPNEAPLAYVRRLAQEKAQAVAQQINQIDVDTQENNQTVALTADTVVILAADTTDWQEDGAVLGKPANANEARQTLQRLRQYPHIVCTAFALWQMGQGLKTLQHVTTTVYMREYSDADIEAYIATGDPFDKAGGYAIQHQKFSPVDRIEGSYTNVVGLPADEVAQALRTLGIPARDIPPNFAFTV
jgi:septum formation protein